jgi:DNA-binding response OmpR family regulator
MKKILLVDDDTLFRIIVREDLIRASFLVEEAASIAGAKKILGRGSFDAILLDIRLPDGNGLDWAEELCRDPRSPPIIFLTTSTEFNMVVRGFEAGCEDYIRKPFENTELILRLRRLFKEFKDINNQDRRIGSYTFNPITHRLTVGESTRILGRLQAAVLDELSIRPGAVVSKEELLNRYWNDVNYFTSRNLDSIIVKLRGHFKEDPSIHFLSLKREGYRLAVTQNLSQEKR